MWLWILMNLKKKILLIKNCAFSSSQHMVMVFQQVVHYSHCSIVGSSRAFFAWMKSNCGDSTAMSKVNYAMFGLGDHNYPHYQAASIVLYCFSLLYCS